MTFQTLLFVCAFEHIYIYVRFFIKVTLFDKKVAQNYILTLTEFEQRIPVKVLLGFGNQLLGDCKPTEDVDDFFLEKYAIICTWSFVYVSIRINPPSGTITKDGS